MLKISSYSKGSVFLFVFLTGSIRMLADDEGFMGVVVAAVFGITAELLAIGFFAIRDRLRRRSGELLPSNQETKR